VIVQGLRSGGQHAAIGRRRAGHLAGVGSGGRAALDGHVGAGVRGRLRRDLLRAPGNAVPGWPWRSRPRAPRRRGGDPLLILGCYESSRRPAGRPPPGSITGGVIAPGGSPPTGPDTGVSNGASSTCARSMAMDSPGRSRTSRQASTHSSNRQSPHSLNHTWVNRLGSLACVHRKDFFPLIGCKLLFQQGNTCLVYEKVHGDALMLSVFFFPAVCRPCGVLLMPKIGKRQFWFLCKC